MWIDDVLPQTVIRSAAWGNPIRDRIVQTFDTLAEANAHVAVLPEGATAYIAEYGEPFVKRGGSWRRTMPKLVYADLVGDRSLSAGGPQTNMWTAGIPAGYRQAQFSWRFRAQGQAGLSYSLLANVFIDGGATGIGSAWFTSLTDGKGHAATPNTHTVETSWDVNPAGTGCIGTLQGLSTVGSPPDGLGAGVDVSGNNYYSRCTILCIP